MTDIGRDEARVVEPFDPTSLYSDVNQINATVMGLAGLVNAALMKFQHVDTHLEELHNIQAGMQANMERVDKYLSMVEQPVVRKSDPKGGSQSKGTASGGSIKFKGTASDPKGRSQSKGTASAAGIKSKGTTSVAGKNKRKKTRAATEILKTKY